jgi:hypothetical protein
MRPRRGLVGGRYSPFAYVEDADLWRPYEPTDPEAPAALLRALRAAGVEHEVRAHEPARHARHLAAIWGVPLPEAGRATLFYAPGARDAGDAPPHPAPPPSGPLPVPVLVLVPADRKIGAPRLRAFLGAAELRVLRADRGVGRVGWRGLPGEPGVLPAVPGLFRARLLVDSLVFERPRQVLALEPGRSLAVAPADYVRVTGAVTADVAGRTLLR